MGEGNGWGVWENLVLEKLKKNDEDHEKLTQTLINIHTDLAILKTSSRLAGALAGFIAASVITMTAALIKHIFK